MKPIDRAAMLFVSAVWILVHPEIGAMLEDTWWIMRTKL